LDGELTKLQRASKAVDELAGRPLTGAHDDELGRAKTHLAGLQEVHECGFPVLQARRDAGEEGISEDELRAARVRAVLQLPNGEPLRRYVGHAEVASHRALLEFRPGIEFD